MTPLQVENITNLQALVRAINERIQEGQGAGTNPKLIIHEDGVCFGQRNKTQRLEVSYIIDDTKVPIEKPFEE